jgi:oxygen-independent coproporphyrinogen-3 oxidase
LIYWRYGDWAGIGPGAHGRLSFGTKRIGNAAWTAPGKWIEAVEAGNGDESHFDLTTQDQVGEHLMMGLRVVEGLDLSVLREMDPTIAPDEAIDQLCGYGLLWKDKTTLGVTSEGRLVLNAVIRELLP